MIKPHAIDHIVLRTDRYQELIDFYCHILGCTVERISADELGITQLRAGIALIDIVDVNQAIGQSGGPAPSRQGHNLDHFCLQIEPFDEVHLKAFLDENGVECGEFHDSRGAQGMGRSIYLTDIAGNKIELRAVVQEN